MYCMRKQLQILPSMHLPKIDGPVVTEVVDFHGKPKQFPIWSLAPSLTTPLRNEKVQGIERVEERGS